MATSQHGIERLRYGGWDEQVPWEKKLSLGEQQRIGLARLIYQKPRFGVLDECTDAVSSGDEKALYQSLFDHGITCITISKRLALEEFHDANLVLGLDTAKGWELRKF
jgi:ABC-type uncharacterized transport system fused permease/ATPase subunit